MRIAVTLHHTERRVTKLLPLGRVERASLTIDPKGHREDIHAVSVLHRQGRSQRHGPIKRCGVRLIQLPELHPRSSRDQWLGFLVMLDELAEQLDLRRFSRGGRRGARVGRQLDALGLQLPQHLWRQIGDTSAALELTNPKLRQLGVVHVLLHLAQDDTQLLRISPRGLEPLHSLPDWMTSGIQTLHHVRHFGCVPALFGLHPHQQARDLGLHEEDILRDEIVLRAVASRAAKVNESTPRGLAEFVAITKGHASHRRDHAHHLCHWVELLWHQRRQDRDSFADGRREHLSAR